MDWLEILNTKKLALLGQIVRRKGYVTEEQIREALEYQKTLENRLPLGEILVLKGYITEENLLGAISEQSGIPCLSPFDYDVGDNISLIIQKEIVERYKVFPLDKKNNILWLVIADPYNREMFAVIKDLTLCKIIPFLALKTEIEKAIEEFY